MILYWNILHFLAFWAPTVAAFIAAAVVLASVFHEELE